MSNIRYFFFNPFRERSMVIWDDSLQGVILDPGFWNPEEAESLFSFTDSMGIDVKAILLTHAHFDHIYGVKECIGKYGVKVYMSPQDKVVKDNSDSLAREFGMPAPNTDWDTVDIHDGQTLCFGGLNFQVITTPGHSPGSVCFYDSENGDLFSGDTLFAGTIGKTSDRYGSYDDEIRSIMDKIMGLDGSVRVHPCHGGGTTIAYERTNNPFLQPFNYKDPETGNVDGIEFNG